MKRLHIFPKVLILMSVVLAAVIVASYALIYFLLPVFYRNHEESRYETLAEEVVSELCSPDRMEEEAQILTDFAQQYGVDVVLYDDNGEIIFDYYQGYTITADYNTDEDEGYSSFAMNAGYLDENTEMICFSKTYEYNGNARTLEVSVSLEQLDEAKAVIIEIYPVAFVCCLALAIIAAAIISNLFVKPIRTLNHSVRQMSAMDSDAYVEVSSQDEIGELGQNINQLYRELRGTIESLGQELTKNQAAENQKIDFLRTISHELKNPLAAANALIEGMLYEIPPYDSDQKEYLMQCKGYLEKASDLARETLQFSKFTYAEDITDAGLKALVSGVASEYTVLINAKQIEYIENVPEDLMVHTNIGMFTKVISNLFSNAVNYTPQRGMIHVYAERQTIDSAERIVLLIENSREPLPEDVLKKLFEHPYKRSAENADSTGLGLYIVNQLLNVLHMRYWFVPSEKSDGMVFKIIID